MACALLQLEDDLLYKLSSAEGDMTEDLALIESLEENKRVADEISEKVAEAKTTEEQINEARNKVCFVLQCCSACSLRGTASFVNSDVLQQSSTKVLHRELADSCLMSCCINLSDKGCRQVGLSSAHVCSTALWQQEGLCCSSC